MNAVVHPVAVGRRFAFDELPESVGLKGRFGPSCHLHLTLATLAALEAGLLRVRIASVGQVVPQDITLRLGAVAGDLAISLGGSGSEVVFGDDTRGTYNLMLWRSSSVHVGAATTSNGVRIFADDSAVSLGEDCMLSDAITIQSADQHGIVDVATRRIVNHRRRSVDIGDHVWLGRHSIVMPDVSIGAGSIVGTGAIVTGNVGRCCVVVGSPARVVREGTSWSRAPDHIDAASARFLSRCTDSTASATEEPR